MRADLMAQFVDWEIKRNSSLVYMIVSTSIISFRPRKSIYIHNSSSPQPYNLLPYALNA